MKKLSSFEIALSALACAFAVICLTVGSYSEILLFSGYLFSSVALMLPLAKQSILGYLLAYGAACILALIFNAGRFWDLLPFIAFFGLHPLVNELQLKTKINRWLACAVKALWFDLTMCLIWKFVFGMTTNIAVLTEYMIPLIFMRGTPFFVLYDYTTYKCRAMVNGLVARFHKK